MVEILLKSICCMFCALGFAILFNSSRKALPYICLLGAVTGLVKFSLLHPSTMTGIILASFAASAAVGFLSIPFSHLCHKSALLLSIPAVIPLVPGSFAFKTMLGIISFTKEDHTQDIILSQTIHNGLMTFFILLALSLGITLPTLLLRVETTKFIGNRKNSN